MTCSKISVLALIFVTHYVRAQEYIDNVIPSKYGPHLKDLPKQFEVRGEDANMQFQKYFEQVQDIAKLDNLTVVYKIVLETVKPSKYKKSFSKKGKTKKYNVPLKKNSMKLSNFEVWLRKMAEQTGHGNNVKKYELYVPVTTESDINKITPMKQIKLKYKPVISKVKNYTKFIRPVKNRIITLTK